MTPRGRYRRRRSASGVVMADAQRAVDCTLAVPRLCGYGDNAELKPMSRKLLAADAGPMLNLRQALYRAARDYRGGVGALALTLGLAPDDLAKRLNPTDSRPLRVELVEEIIAATADARLLDAVTRPAGALWYRVEPVEASGDALQALARLFEREGAFVSHLAQRTAAGGAWSAAEVAELESIGHGLVRRLLGIVAGARASMEECEDG